jgi:hypothetical protein
VISDGKLLFLTGKSQIYALKPTTQSEHRADVFGRRLTAKKGSG